ncbi:MAG: helix-turn-helix domain-containing protein [Gemmatimonadaceae bacterium]
MEYIAIITREGRHTLATFPDAPGCQTFAEPGEAIAAEAREALEGWLASGLAHGEAPPRPSARVHKAAGKGVLPVRISPALAVRLQIRWARADEGISQGQLAKRVGVTRQAISQLESPDANLRLSTLEKVAGALGMALDIELVPAEPACSAGAR